MTDASMQSTRDSSMTPVGPTIPRPPGVTRQSMVKYVYICSAPHSGSTVLDLLLGSHSQVASLGEIDHLSKNLALDTQCGCRRPIRSCPVWNEVVTRVGQELGVDILHRPYALHMGYPRASSVVDRAHQTRAYLLRRRIVLGLFFLRARVRAGLVPDILVRGVEQAIRNTVLVFDAVRDVLGVDIVIDSSKSYLKALALYEHDPESVRILLLTRDGRGVWWSNLKRGVPKKHAVKSWRNQYARALPLLKRNIAENHLLQVKYEALTSEPAAELERICSFLGVRFEPQMLDFREKVHHTTNGNRVRLAGPSTLRADSEWQTRLSPRDLRFFDRYGAETNRLLGYE